MAAGLSRMWGDDAQAWFVASFHALCGVPGARASRSEHLSLLWGQVAAQLARACVGCDEFAAGCGIGLCTAYICTVEARVCAA